MNLADAKDIYVGQKPVDEVWVGGSLVWERLKPTGIGLMLASGEILDYSIVMKDTAKTYELSEVVGVTVEKSEASFVIHPNYGRSGRTSYFCSGDQNISQEIFKTSNEYEADTHFNGYEDTQTIIEEFNKNDVYLEDVWAAGACSLITFNNGEHGYLMSTGEAKIIYDNREIINELLKKINGADSIVDGKGIWTSTVNELNSGGQLYIMWYLMEKPSDGHFIDGHNVQGLKYTRPLARINKD